MAPTDPTPPRSFGSSLPLPAFLRRPVFREMFHFMSVGVVNLCLSWFIFDVATRGLRSAVSNVQLRLVTANALAFAITVTTAFILNSRITFRERGADARAYWRYAIVNLVGFGLNTLLILAYSQLIALLRHETLSVMVDQFPLGKNLAYLAAVGCVFFWNFFMSRHWVFRPRIEVAAGPTPPHDGFHDASSERTPGAIVAEPAPVQKIGNC